MKIYKFFFVVLILCFIAGSKQVHAQSKRFVDSSYLKRFDNAKKNVDGLTALLGLSVEQREKMERLELVFNDRVNELRNSFVSGRVRSQALNELYLWREKEIVDMLTQKQTALLDARNKQIQQKIEQSTKNRSKKSSPGTPVKLNRKG